MIADVILGIAIAVYVIILVLIVCAAFGCFEAKIKKWHKAAKRIVKKAKKNQNNWAAVRQLQPDVEKLLNKIVVARKKGWYSKWKSQLKKTIDLLEEALQAVDAPTMVNKLIEAEALLRKINDERQQTINREIAMYKLKSAAQSSHKMPRKKRRSAGLFDSFPSSSSSRSNGRKLSDYHDSHWESSFDWQDRDNDGYDDRSDGFWQEAE